MTGPMQPPPADLLVVERIRVQVALTAVQEGPPGGNGPITEELALVLDLEGHDNGSIVHRLVRCGMGVEETAKLAAGLLNALDAMRAHSHDRAD